MADGITTVKRLIAAGSNLTLAVRSALGDGRTIKSVAEERGVVATMLSASLRGQKLATDSEVAAMVAELGGTTQQWRELFSDAMRRTADLAVSR